VELTTPYQRLQTYNRLPVCASSIVTLSRATNESLFYYEKIFLWIELLSLTFTGYTDWQTFL